MDLTETHLLDEFTFRVHVGHAAREAKPAGGGALGPVRGLMDALSGRKRNLRHRQQCLFCTNKRRHKQDELSSLRSLKNIPGCAKHLNRKSQSGSSMKIVNSL